MMNNRNKTSAIIFILSTFILSVFFSFPVVIFLRGEKPSLLSNQSFKEDQSK